MWGKIVMADGETQSSRALRNRQAIGSSDLPALLTAAATMVPFIWSRYQAKEFDIAAAVAGSTFVFHLLTLSLLLSASKRFRNFFIHWRELFGAAVIIHAALNCRILANHTERQQSFDLVHGGSPLRLMTMMLAPWSHWFWVFLYSSYFRVPRKCTIAIVLVSAAVPLLYGRSPCHKFIVDASTHAPIHALYSWLSFVSSLLLLPLAMPMASEHAPPESDPLSQCLVVDAWGLLVVGIGLTVLLKLFLDQPPAQRAAPAADTDQPLWSRYASHAYIYCSMAWLLSCTAVEVARRGWTGGLTEPSPL